MAEGPRYLVVGRIVAPWGVRGEVKVEILTAFPYRFSGLKMVYLGPEYEPCALRGFRLHKGFALLRLEGCSDRNAAERLRGQLIHVPVEEAVLLGEDEYYIYQIIGLEVWTGAGVRLGRVVEVLFTGANEVYVVKGERGEILIPAIEEVVKRVDLEAGRLLVEPLEGLLDLS